LLKRAETPQAEAPLLVVPLRARRPLATPRTEALPPAGGNATKEGAAGATTGSSTPSAKDASTQGAGTAGSVEKKGDATTPGGTMKK